MTQEVENCLARREQWLRRATAVVKTHAPLLTDAQAREVAIIAIKAWQDLRQTQEWAETSDFLRTL